MNANNQKIALITGITGQDGSYLAEFLLDKGYEVHGTIRRSSSFNTGRIEHLYLDEWVRDMKHKRLINLHYADMTDSSSLIRLIEEIKPDEIYNLAAQSHVKVSFEVPEYTAETVANGVLRLLEGVRIAGRAHCTKIYQASTSELYGQVQEVPQRETTPFYPRSPYAVAKLYAYWIMVNYREAYGMYCSNGILFNHESERRGENFVTRKITFAVARITQGLQDKLYLGNLNACASSAPWHSTMPASNSNGKAMASTKKASTKPPARCWWRLILDFSAPPRWSNCWATPPRPKHNWAGIHAKPALNNW